MKARILVLCSVLVAAIVGLSLTILNQRVSESGPRKHPVATPDSTEVSVTRMGDAPNNGNTEEKSSAPAVSGEPENVDDCLRGGAVLIAGGIHIIARKLKRNPIVSYPQIASPTTRQQRRFNVAVQSIARRELTGEEGADFVVSYATPEFVSALLWTEFCGASCHVGEIPFNFDLTTGTRIENLSELFKPRTAFLKSIASYCIAEFKRCGWDTEDDWFKKGTQPRAENYEIWGLNRDGVEITFPEYQIAPGVFPGTSVVVPYSHLREMLRRDVDWFRRLPR